MPYTRERFRHSKRRRRLPGWRLGSDADLGITATTGRSESSAEAARLTRGVNNRDKEVTYDGGRVPVTLRLGDENARGCSSCYERAGGIDTPLRWQERNEMNTEHGLESEFAMKDGHRSSANELDLEFRGTSEWCSHVH
ncbi:hypothetical protein LIA77_03845 [Sarocladium implicatum]|nr:hypothetical protein LIA77_03845 [Sarocladium implicatum]